MQIFFNLLLPIATYITRLAKIFNFNFRMIIKKNSYERRNYESVYEKSLS